MDATAETVNFDFTAAFTTGSQFSVTSSTGNPVGGNLFLVDTHDASVIPFRVDSSAGEAFRVDADREVIVNSQLGVNKTDAVAEPLHIVADAGDDIARFEENTGGEYFSVDVDASGDLRFITDSGTLALELSDVAGGVIVPEGLTVGATGTPQEPLHVVTDAAGDAIRVEENTGGEHWNIGVSTSGNLGFFADVGDVEALRLINANGNILMGSSTQISVHGTAICTLAMVCIGFGGDLDNSGNQHAAGFNLDASAIFRPDSIDGNSYGMWIEGFLTDTDDGVIVNAYGIKVDALTEQGANSVTNGYGIHVTTPSTGFTNTWAAYVDGDLEQVNGLSTIRRVKSENWQAGDMSADATECSEPSKVTINSGPKVSTVACAMGTSETDGFIYGEPWVLPDGFDKTADIIFELSAYLTADNGAGTWHGVVDIQCQANGEIIDSTWGTGIGLDLSPITGDVVNDVIQGISTAVDTDTTGEDCDGGEVLFWRWKSCDTDATPSTGCTSSAGFENDMSILSMKAEYTASTDE